jgi:hypothetical protein
MKRAIVCAMRLPTHAKARRGYPAGLDLVA